MRAKVQHRQDKSLDDELEPSIKIGLHRERQTDKTLLDHSRRATIEDSAIKALLRSEMIAEQRHGDTRCQADLSN